MNDQPGRPIRLLHVFSTLKVGGPQCRFRTLVRGLGPAYHHMVFAMDGRYEALEGESFPASVERLDLSYQKPTSIRDFLAFRRAIKRSEADLYVTYNWGAIEWGLVGLTLPFVPHMDIEDGFGPEEIQARLPRRNKLRRLVYGRARSVIVPSLVLDGIATREWGLKKPRLRYIPNGIDTDLFGKPGCAELKQQFGLDHDGPIVGTVAALRQEKNLTRLVEAFAPLAERYNAMLVIVGDGPEREPLEIAAREHGIDARTVFTGNLQQPEKILPHFDIFALSSDTEQMPVSVLEAMGCGLPVASVDVGDVREMVAPENQAHVEGRDVKSLRDSLDALLSDEKRRREIGVFNRKRVEQVYPEKGMVAAYDEAFRAASGRR